MELRNCNSFKVIHFWSLFPFSTTPLGWVQNENIGQKWANKITFHQGLTFFMAINFRYLDLKEIDSERKDRLVLRN